MRLDQKRLQKLYPQMDEAFARRMEQMIHSLPVQKEDTQVKKTAFPALLAFVLLAVLGMATACAVIRYGLDWYYSTRFTAYQEHEPQKHAAIMEHLQSDLPQTAAGDELVHIQITEASLVQEERVMVAVLTASPKDPETYELHPMWNLDADGAYVGEGGAENPENDGEDRAVHWLWTSDGFGPAEQMIAEGKQLLLIDTGDIRLGGHQVLGDGSSMDAFVAEDGTVHTVLEVHLDMLADDYEETMRKQMADNPEYAAYLEKRLEGDLEIRRIIEEDADGTVTFTIPFTTTLYTDDDQQLYHGGQSGNITFEMKIK